MRRTLYNLTAGIYTAIPALQFARRVEIIEDGSVASVGLLVKFPEDNFTAIFEYPAAQQPVVLGNDNARGGGGGPIQGWPAQTGLNLRAADTYVMITAASATTKIRVWEID